MYFIENLQAIPPVQVPPELPERVGPADDLPRHDSAVGSGRHPA